MKQDKKWLMAGLLVASPLLTGDRAPGAGAGDPTSYEDRQRTQCLGVRGSGLWSDQVPSFSSSPTLHCIVC